MIIVDKEYIIKFDEKKIINFKIDVEFMIKTLIMNS